MTCTLDDLLTRARSQLGVTEDGSGRTRYGIWWGVPDMDWCAVFLMWCADQTGGLGDTIPRETFANLMIRAFQRDGRLGETPKVGAVVGFDWSGDRNSIDAVDHVALVEAVHPDGTITTIGGNESNAVVRRRRSTRYAVTYGYPRYRAARQHPRTLRQGNTGDTVRLLQRLLGIKADGIFGPLTEAAVRAFQRRAGLTVDGIVGPATWTALGQ